MVTIKPLSPYEHAIVINDTDALDRALTRRLPSRTELEECVLLAVEKNQQRNLAVLMQHGASVRFDHDEPLREALRCNMAESVKFLLHCGADPLRESGWFWQFAQENCSTVIIDALQNAIYHRRKNAISCMKPFYTHSSFISSQTHALLHLASFGRVIKALTINGNRRFPKKSSKKF